MDVLPRLTFSSGRQPAPSMTDDGRRPHGGLAAVPALRRAVVVASDSDSRQSLRTLLLGNGFDCHEAPTMAEALILTSIRGAEVVLLDLGVKDFGYLRPDDLAAPVVVLVGSGQQDLAAKALEGGAVDCVPRPISPSVLLRQLDLALEHARGDIGRDGALTERRRPTLPVNALYAF